MTANLGGFFSRGLNGDPRPQIKGPAQPPVPRHAGFLLAVAALVAALIAGAVAPSGRVARAAPSDETADAVFGQAGSFATAVCNLGGTSASTLCVPAGMAFDSAGNLFVADDFNNRVLEYNTPLTTDLVADRVFGQLGSFVTSTANNGGVSANSLFNPVGLVLDDSNNLYVADSMNNRVLEYDSPISTDTTADRVFGQTLFTTNAVNMGGTPTAGTLSAPRAVSFDASGRLYVSDVSNNRVLVYNGPLSDATADFVLGQAGSFTTGSCNMGGTPTASTLCAPGGSVIDAFDHLYLSDSTNNRVLEYDSPLTTDTVADRVLGQIGSFTSNTCNNGGISNGSLCFPAGLARDRAGNLFVADYTNNRTLVYADPLYLDLRADRVLGQGGSFSSGTCNNGGISATSQCLPIGVILDAAQNLFVTDGGNNHRLLEYDAPVDFIVNSSNDVDDTVCNAAHCSLREAINAANSAAGFNAIEFSVGAGLVTITPTSALPTVSGVVNIDGTTQPGYAGTGPLVEIRGDSAGGGVDGITVTAGSSLLRGIVVNRFAGNGIRLTGSGGNTIVTSGAGRDLLLAVQPNGGIGVLMDTPNNQIGIGTLDRDGNVFSGNTGDGIRIAGLGASGNIITNNAIGTNGNLTNIDQGNTGDGVHIEGAPGNTVFYNVLSGNESDGIEINGPTATGNVVRQNVIGTDRFGVLDLGNTQNGVRVLNATGNSIGLSAAPGYGNLISGNGVNGVDLDGDTNSVKGNLIGTNLAGTAAIANSGHGIRIVGHTGNQIGGATGADGNVISGNTADGVFINGSPAGGNTIAGNLIGVNAAGTATLGNGAHGVDLAVISFGVNGSNLVGGTTPAARNVIAGNGTYGINLNLADGTIVQGNYIGLLPNGTAAGNAIYGVVVSPSSNSTTIGGTSPGARNVISSNSGGGILLSSNSSTVQGNYIGTDPAGLFARPNSGNGIAVTGTGNAIGGSAAGAGNIISGNTVWGINLGGATGNTIKGNGIGTNAAGQPLGNSGFGVGLYGGASGNAIGGTGAGDGNTIANNTSRGVSIFGVTTAGNSVRGNSIYANVGAGIDLASGGNGSLAAPTITLAAATVNGTTSCSGCQIDVYSDNADEGRVYQGTVTATGTSWSFVGPIAGPNVTATVTDGSGNTSPFSGAVAVNLLREAGSPGNAGFNGDAPIQANDASVRLDGPHGLFKTAGGDLYFADMNNNRIRKISPNSPLGTLSTVAGSSLTPGFADGLVATALLAHPNDVAVDGSGNVFVADTDNCRIRKVAAGAITTIAGTGTCGYNGEGTATGAQLNHPYGVTVDGSGNVFIADTDNNRIRRIDAGTGDISTIAGTGLVGYTGDGGPATAATLRRPYDIVISVLGKYIVADTDNSGIRSIDIGSGIISTIAGTGVTPYNGDGIPAVNANLDHPQQVSADAQGDVYIADTNHNRVRHVSQATGIIQTAVGIGTTGVGDPDAIDAYIAHLDHPAGVAAGSLTVADTGNQIIRTVLTNNDPTGAPSTPHPGSGNFCTQKFASPLAGIADWSVIMMTVGLIGARRRVRWLFQLLSARLRLRQNARALAG